jgi:hypothetical protein
LSVIFYSNPYFRLGIPEGRRPEESAAEGTSQKGLCRHQGKQIPCAKAALRNDKGWGTTQDGRDCLRHLEF